MCKLTAMSCLLEKMLDKTSLLPVLPTFKPKTVASNFGVPATICAVAEPLLP
jgi:hypothetical protein